MGAAIRARSRPWHATTPLVHRELGAVALSYLTGRRVTQ
jgi:hypothetical protein